MVWGQRQQGSRAAEALSAFPANQESVSSHTGLDVTALVLFLDEGHTTLGVVLHWGGWI